MGKLGIYCIITTMLIATSSMYFKAIKEPPGFMKELMVFLAMNLGF